VAKKINIDINRTVHRRSLKNKDGIVANKYRTKYNASSKTELSKYLPMFTTMLGRWRRKRSGRMKNQSEQACIVPAMTPYPIKNSNGPMTLGGMTPPDPIAIVNIAI
jgi:hypothetical protein